MRIIETDPKQFDVDTTEGETQISFTITPVTAKGFPIILIGKNIHGEEIIIRNKKEPLIWHEVPKELLY